MSSGVTTIPRFHMETTKIQSPNTLSNIVTTNPNKTMKSDFSMASILLIDNNKDRVEVATADSDENPKKIPSIIKQHDKQQKQPLLCRLENNIPSQTSLSSSLESSKLILQEKDSMYNPQPSLQRLPQQSGGTTSSSTTTNSSINNNDKVRVTLDDLELWKGFHRLTNEMIVTKNGRYLFVLLLNKVLIRHRGL